MNWIKKALHSHDTLRTSGGVLFELLNGDILEEAARELLLRLGDPETCNNIETLIQDVRTDRYPNGHSILYAMKEKMECGEFAQQNKDQNQNLNEIVQPVDPTESMESTDQQEI